MQFVPSDLPVAVGDVVVWTNEDIVPHTATSPGTFDSQQLSSKQQWRYTVTTAGTISYTCTFHPTMLGTITAR
jgi:plastocyanin